MSPAQPSRVYTPATSAKRSSRPTQRTEPSVATARTRSARTARESSPGRSNLSPIPTSWRACGFVWKPYGQQKSDSCRCNPHLVSIIETQRPMRIPKRRILPIPPVRNPTATCALLYASPCSGEPRRTTSHPDDRLALTSSSPRLPEQTVYIGMAERETKIKSCATTFTILSRIIPPSACICHLLSFYFFNQFVRFLYTSSHLLDNNIRRGGRFGKERYDGRKR